MSAKGLIVGAAFGMTAAVLCSVIFGSVVSFLLFTVGTPLLYIEIFLQAIVPFLILFSLAGAQFRRIDRAKEVNKWIISIIMAFFVITYAGTIGSLGTHVLVWKAELVDLAVGDIIVWGFLYGILLLPLAAPISRWLILVLMHCCKFFDSTEGGV